MNKILLVGILELPFSREWAAMLRTLNLVVLSCQSKHRIDLGSSTRHRSLNEFIDSGRLSGLAGFTGRLLILVILPTFTEAEHLGGGAGARWKKPRIDPLHSLSSTSLIFVIFIARSTFLFHALRLMSATGC